MTLTPRTAAIAATALALIGLGAGWWAVNRGGASADAFAQCRQGVVSGGGAIGGPFTLVDENGKTVTDQEVFTKPSLLYFGYTFCPDVCPLDSARNAEAATLLEEKGMDVTPVFISVDPARDTPEVVRDFTDALHPKMIGLTGSPEQVAAASRAYRTYYKAQSPDDDYYLVDHSTQTYLVLPKTGFVEFFNRDVSPQQMADRVECFVKAAS
ncbi:SCO family protein [Paracoccus sp. p4-l81]|uniref:SCO family protein n=1 Tax=unclassified Paracoccus (in: a-proteobacteria) TaxID=2688777 RepID=UPI0035B81929